MQSDESAVEKAQERTFSIVVNAREKKVSSQELSFAQVVALADNLPTGANVIYTVTFKNADGHKEGTLVAGQTVTIKNGTIFNVSATSQS